MAATKEGLIPTEVDDYLQLHHIITLSTASFTGMPHANTVTYASDDRFMYFAAPTTTQIVRNIGDNHYVSFTIDDYTTDWRKARELQGVGRCQTATAEDDAAIAAAFAAKFGGSAPRPDGELFVIQPFEMHFVDYSYELNAGTQLLSEVTSRQFQIEESDEPASAAVATSLGRTSFEAGAVVFRPGDAVGRYFIVLEGEVELRGEGHGADQTVTRVVPGQLFGDQAALFGHRGALTAHAITNTVVLEVQRDAMRDLLLPRSS